MRLLLFRSLWTNGFDLESALADCGSGTFDGVEGPVPLESAARQEFSKRLADSGAPFIAEIATGGGYVPDARSPERHLDDLRRGAEAAMTASPLFLTILAGCDAWPLAQSVDFFARALGVAEEFGVEASFETHRSRPSFNPWATRDLLTELPTLKLTCDFSHWCCVSERLVLDGEPDILALCAERARHIHARVGYEQGPQAPHPAAPEYRAALAAHERWWEAIWSRHEHCGREYTSLTPEFGPDGYLQKRPFTAEPAGDLDQINSWMATRQAERFNARKRANVSSGAPIP